MYLGPREEPIPLWSQRWIDGPFGRGGHIQSYRAGWTTRIVHDYQCDCGRRTAGQVIQADEPFFCAACTRLISLAPLGDVVQA